MHVSLEPMNNHRLDLDSTCILNVVRLGSARRQVTNRALKDPWWLQLRLSIRRRDEMQGVLIRWVALYL